ncbi:MAG: caspase family protein [Cellvibrionaceae bacterium]
MTTMKQRYRIKSDRLASGARPLWRSLLKICSVGLLAVTSLELNAAQRALLVGVADYPSLPPAMQLDGPVHDAEIVSAILQQRGFQQSDIRTLLTAEGHESPTKANILAALEEAVQQAKSDDFYYLHFAGHGSRQPASVNDNTEADGLDEIFLPTDVKRWDSFIGAVENAIVDDEIASYVDRIRDRGADVWLVFDSCHSGTMTRGASAMPEVKYRRLDSSLLGIPDDILVNRPEHKMLAGTEFNSRGQAPTASLEDQFVNASQLVDLAQGASIDDGAERGDLIAFSAAQSTETTPEMKLPRGAPERRFHGLFTYTLMQVLGSNEQLTYHQLAQQVMSRYQTTPWKATTPLFSATDMNRLVFGDSQGHGFSAQLDNNRLNIEAGSLSLLSKGAEVELFKAGSSGNEAVANLKISGATPVRSWIDVDQQRSKTWPTNLYVRLKTPAASEHIQVALLPSQSMSQSRGKQLSAWLTQIEQAQVGIAVSSIEQADVLVSEFDESLWFLQADQSLPCEEQALTATAKKHCDTTRLPQQLLNLPLDGLVDKQQSQLQASLTKIANVTRLMNSRQLLPGTQQQLEVDFRIERNGEFEAFPINKSPTLREGDTIHFTVKNVQRQPQDVSIVFVDSQYGITQLYPEPGQPNRLQHKEQLSFEWLVNVDTVGSEHLLLSTQTGKGINSDLSYLEQAPLNVSTRGLGSRKATQSSGIDLYSWNVAK